MLIQSHFCPIPGHPYANLEFAPREVKIVGRDGKVVYQATVTAPTKWSETAVKMLAQKYCRKAGVPAETIPVDEPGIPLFLRRSVPAPGTTFGGETDFRKVFDRLAGCWGYWGWKKGYFSSEDDAARFVDEAMAMLARQVFAPNTPQWLNCGLAWAYGIQGDPEGRWAIDETGEAVRETPDTYSRPSVGACYILSLEDTLLGPDGIMDFMVRESRIFKAGSGSGASYSRVRGKDEPLSHGGKSSGLLSFLKPIDSNAGAIKSGGTSRRAARMVIVEDDHPDVEAFVDWKALEEKKVAALVAGGKLLKHHLPKVHAAALAGDDRELTLARANALTAGVPRQMVDQAEAAGRESLPAPVVPGIDSADFEADAYTTVSGQNANNSVSLSAAFMAAVKADGLWDLHWRTEKVKAAAEGRDPKPCKTIKARHLWDRIARAAWECADPGVYFSTTVNDWHTCAEDGSLEGCNPCAEFHFLNNSTCNLACLNLVVLQGNDHKQTARNVRRAARLVTLILDITVTMSSYPSKAVAEGAMKYRTVGLGFSNLGGLLMRNGIPYDSDAGRGWAACLTGLIHFTAASTSAELAGVVGLGAFPRYEANAKHVERVLVNHAAFLNGGGYYDLTVEPPDPTAWLTAAPIDLVESACDAARTALADHKKYGGLRNAQLSLVMPAGTVGLTMDCDTTGCEPDFSLVKHKELAGGGYMTIANQSVRPALETLGYAEKDVAAIVAHVLSTGTVTGAPGLKAEHLPVFDTANGDRAISIEGHLGMMAAIQPLVSGSISKCVTGETIIQTDQGLQRIADLYTGESPDTYRQLAGLRVPTSVGLSAAAAFYYGGRKPVWKVTFSDGRTIRGTEVHRLRTADVDGLGWKALPDLQPGDFVGLRLGANVWGQDRVPEVETGTLHGSQHRTFRCPTSDQAVDVARFLGLLTSDGHVTVSTYTVGLTKNCDEVRAEFTRLLATLFGLNGREIQDARNGVKGVTIGSKSLVTWLRGIGWNKQAIPTTVLGGSRASVLAYLSGLYTDGHITTKGHVMTLSQKHRSLLDDVQAIWDNLGVATYLLSHEVNGTTYWNLHVVRAHTQTAAHALTWLEPHKAALAANVTEGSDRSDAFPLRRPMLEQAIRDRKMSQTFRSVFDPRTRHLSRKLFLTAADAVGLPLTAEERELRYVTVVSVEPDGEDEVYDLSVPGPEQFVGNGIVNHNTLNLPSDCTVADVRETYARAYALGLKCAALYRDQSKMSQPLQAAVKEEKKAEPASPTPAARDAQPKRQPLPNRRKGYTQKFRVPGHKVYLNTGEYPGGDLGEIFITTNKEGATLKSFVNAFAQAVSIGLQYGVPLDEFVDAFVFTRFEPNGPVTGHDRLRSCTSLLDAIFRDLAISYLGRDDLGHTLTLPPPASAAPGVSTNGHARHTDAAPADNGGVATAVRTKAEPKAVAEVQYIGTPCPACGLFACVMDGKCAKCTRCGASGGCTG